jgi:DNA-binding NarL/FixJ family response regulator
MYDEAIYAERCLRAGAEGYIQKQDEVDKILEGVRTLLGGGPIPRRQECDSADTVSVVGFIGSLRRSSETAPVAGIADLE